MNDLNPPVDLNRASRDEILTLPGLDIEIIDRILKTRPYTSLDQFRKKCALSKSQFKAIRPYLLFGQPLEETARPALLEAQADERATNLVGTDPAVPNFVAIEFVSSNPILTDLTPSPNYEDDSVSVPTNGHADEQIAPTWIDMQGPSPAMQQIDWPQLEKPSSATAAPNTPGASEPELATPVLTSVQLTLPAKGPSENTTSPVAIAPAASPTPETMVHQQAAAAPPAPLLPVSQPTPDHARAKPLTRRELLAWVAATILVTTIVSVLLTLGILSMINGSLTSITPAQFNNLNRQVITLNSQTKTLATDLDGLRARLDTLDSLSGRINTVEKDTQAIHSQLDESAKQVSKIQDQMTSVAASIQTLQKSSQTFQDFLMGLKILLNGTAKP